MLSECVKASDWAKQMVREWLETGMLEADNELQDAVLSIHHACVATLQGTAAKKITENQLGIAFIQQAQQLVRI
jgi:hypothetical protein